MKTNHIRIALSVGTVLLAATPAATFAQATVPPEIGAQAGAASGEKLTPACRAAKQYVDYIIESKLYEIGKLFADKVDYIGPDAVHRTSGEDVGKAYAKLGVTSNPKKTKVRLTRLVPLHDNECFMEFDAFDYATNSYRLTAIDHFIVGPDGKVIWFRPFFQQLFDPVLFNNVRPK